jgi:hypothetical protein
VTDGRENGNGRGRAYCGAKKRQGEGFCHRPAGWGTDHVGSGRCKLHGGSTRSGKTRAARQLAATLGEELDVEPQEALLRAVRIAAREVSVWTEFVVALADDELVVRVRREREWAGGERGAGYETMTSTDAHLNVLLRARHEALDRMAKYAKAAIDAGVAERQVRVQEQQAERYAAGLRVVLELVGGVVGVDLLALPETPDIVRRGMLELERGSE